MNSLDILRDWREKRERANALVREKRHRWASMGLCSTCGHKRTPDRKTCESCLKNNREGSRKELAYRKSLNVCIDCLGEKGRDGTTVRCNSCREKHNARYRVYKDKKRTTTCDNKHTRSPRLLEVSHAPIPASSPYNPSDPSNQSESRQQLQ